MSALSMGRFYYYQPAITPRLNYSKSSLRVDDQRAGERSKSGRSRRGARIDVTAALLVDVF